MLTVDDRRDLNVCAMKSYAQFAKRRRHLSGGSGESRVR
jgi:hypothetical protein